MPEKKNYESKYWGLIYDQMMEGDLADWLYQSRTFYATHLDRIGGPVLECACGTGLVLIDLLERGFDIYGFDISRSMLEQLIRKAPHAIERVSQQALETFSYHDKFEAVIIPTNSFSMLTTRDAQLATLRNVAAHLAPGGRLMMDIRLVDPEELSANPDSFEGNWHEWTHPETNEVIRQRIVAHPHDFKNQGYRDRCFIEYRDDREEFPMDARWIFREEFEDLLRLSAFTSWQVEDGEWGSYWIATGSG